ncbi:sulfate transporter family-domain-containing protein [Infundibulicybe gibba]|nr:sulfate transporter family-domain-containing protein [Infundibulicybe gibba]
MATATAKRLGKRIIDYPEDAVPVVSSTEWTKPYTSNPRDRSYFVSLFPIFGWISRYNLGWFTGDVIAGLTVGIVLVPQGMSYAQIATLPPEYGLYSSFVGVLIYCFFATSKDVSIGPVAVMSLTVSQIIKNVQGRSPGEWEGPQIATTVAFVCGFIVLGVGLLRLGWLVEFIPAPAVSGFMTGSAISIAAGQVPGLMGITGFDTRAATYLVIINTLKGLPRTTLDAAWGLTGLASLYIIRIICLRLTERFPRRARMLFFLSVLRNAFVLLVLTIAAWLYTRHRKDSKGKYPIKILQNVPAGLKHVGRPLIDPKLVSELTPELPVATIILLLEHIAISNVSFGRLNGYKINPNQELIAIGVTNTVGSCFGAYPATGSCFVRLDPAFFWIPNAALSAVIIHAVADLVASPAQVYSYWRVSPLEFVIWLAAVFVTIFLSIEDGIYTSIIASIVLLLIRVAHPRGAFLGKVTIQGQSDDTPISREVYLPLEKMGITNSHIKVVPPSPGVLVYRFEESYLFPNSSIVNSALVDHVKERMRRGRDMSNVRPSDRPWNDPGPRNGSIEEQFANEKRPVLHAVVLDFSSVSHIDTTAVQALIDTRTEIEKWADHPVEFHFATILSPWIRRALIAGGFGIGISASRVPPEIAAVVPYRGGRSDDDSQTEVDIPGDDVEIGDLKRAPSTSSYPRTVPQFVPVISADTPFFHLDLQGAVRAAESGVSRAPNSVP